MILNRCLIGCVLRALSLTKRCLLRFAMPTTGVSFYLAEGWNFSEQRKACTTLRKKTQKDRSQTFFVRFPWRRREIIDFWAREWKASEEEKVRWKASAISHSSYELLTYTNWTHYVWNVVEINGQIFFMFLLPHLSAWFGPRQHTMWNHKNSPN